MIDGGEPKVVIQTLQPEVDANIQALASEELGKQCDPKDALAADRSDSLLDGMPESMIGVEHLNGRELVNGRGGLFGEVIALDGSDHVQLMSVVD